MRTGVGKVNGKVNGGQCANLDSAQYLLTMSTPTDQTRVPYLECQ